MDKETKIRDGFIGQKMIIIPYGLRQALRKNELVKGLYLTSMGYFPHASAHFRERKNGSGEFILIYCVQGHGSIYLGKKKYDLFANSYFIIPINEAHRYASSNEDPWSIYWLHFSGSMTAALFDRYADKKELTVKSVAYDENRIEVFNNIYAILSNGFQVRNIELANIKLLQLVTSLVYSEDLIISLDKSDAISQSISFMKDNLKNYFSVEELASKLNYSTSHYTHLFKTRTGFAPIHYFNQLKVQKCCQYLSFTDLSVKEICFKLGFQDPYYFSRIFKKFMDVSPANYRKMHRH